MAVAFQVGACTAEDMMLVYTTATDVLVNGFVLYQLALKNKLYLNILQEIYAIKHIIPFIKRMAV